MTSDLSLGRHGGNITSHSHVLSDACSHAQRGTRRTVAAPLLCTTKSDVRTAAAGCFAIKAELLSDVDGGGGGGGGSGGGDDKPEREVDDTRISVARH